MKDIGMKKISLKKGGGKIRPKKMEVINMLYSNGFKSVIEVDLPALLLNHEEGLGDSNPYSLENVSDYITGNRSLIIGYKTEIVLSPFLDKLAVVFPKPGHPSSRRLPEGAPSEGHNRV